ncbi:hypothetical protein FA95DRAFT_1554048 [Auriscalpium vulgare]|uniref:Uncharacterized protein n=1 Tax=Auriscalpium vulgare TaxID=40419 RepID=A0ACB8S6B1_9AGAM|nr:hypothetical protein FA95DRAFT_1554048 [Auriscalpium vulgare]
MHIRHHAQRQHIIDSLETLLYQLHVVSYFMAPSVLSLLTRCAAQFQLSKPRDFDAKRSLRFWFLLILIFNFGSLWNHAVQGAPEGRSIVLDFVGMAFTPSRLQLLLLDFTIVFLSIVIATIAYETSYTLAAAGNSIHDPLLTTPFPNTSDMPSTSLPLVAKAPVMSPDTIIIDLRWSLLLRHIRSPPPPPPEVDAALLPMPNTTSATARLSEGMRILMQARAGLRARMPVQAPPPPTGDGGDTARNQRRVPGGMEDSDVGA